MDTLLAVFEKVYFNRISDNYARNIKRALNKLSMNGHLLDDLTPAMIDSRIADLQKTMSDSSVNIWRANCSAAFAEAQKHGLVQQNPFRATKKLKLEPQEIRVITDWEESHLFKTCDQSRKRERDRMTIALALYGGMRAHEIARFNIRTDIGTDNNVIASSAKTQRKRTVTLPGRYMQELRAYATVRRKRSAQYPFFNRSGKKVSRRFSDIASVAGISCTLHDLRHTCATRLARMGVSKWELREYLGHKSIETTQQYYIGIVSPAPDIWDTHR